MKHKGLVLPNSGDQHTTLCVRQYGADEYHSFAGKTFVAVRDNRQWLSVDLTPEMVVELISYLQNPPVHRPPESLYLIP